MDFQPFDRLPLLEWAGWWDQTLDRWRTEGLAPNLTDRYEIAEHFGLDLYKQIWFRAKRGGPVPAHHGAGVIRDEADYEALLPHLYPRFDPGEYPQLGEWREEQAAGLTVIWFTFDGFFWFPRTLLGIERHLYAFYDQPDLMHRINDDLREWQRQFIDDLGQVCCPDFVTFAEDLSYNHGPMLSEDLFDRFLAPHYRKVIPHLRQLGARVLVDSDGDITSTCEWFARAGIEGLLPLERQSGVDIDTLRARHPQMRFVGHFDKLVMNRGDAAICAEFERLLDVAAGGGFIPSCDHQTPPGVSLAEYRRYVAIFREFAAEVGSQSRRGTDQDTAILRAL